MAKGFQFKPDAEGIVRVASGPAVAPTLTDAARRAAIEIRKLGPVHRHSFFDWKTSVKAFPATRGADGGFEAGVAVDSPGWHLVEFGTATVRAMAPLRRGILLAGIELRTTAGFFG